MANISPLNTLTNSYIQLLKEGNYDEAQKYAKMLHLLDPNEIEYP